MSLELLRHLRSHYAFDATPGVHDLGVYHVPFDELLGGVRVEGRLARGVRAGERIAVVGGGGSGKSSVIAGVLGGDARGIAPIVVPLLGSAPERLTDPMHVIDRVLDVVLGAARAAERLHADEVEALRLAATGDRTVERVRTAAVELALPWLRPNLGREVRELAETRGGLPIEDRIDLVADVLRRVAGDDLQPVLVFDDTDRWLAGQLRNAVAGFFGPVLRTVNELPASLVVSVNRDYEPRRDVLAHLDTVVEVPDLESSGQLRALLDRRVAANVAGTEYAGAAAADVFDGRAVTALFHYYGRRGVYLREVIQLAHRAIGECVDHGEGIVTKWFVQGSLPDR